MGTPVPFDTSIAGANGETEAIIDGARYKVYGEFMVVNGTINVVIL
jgi:hypothetical protein